MAVVSSKEMLKKAKDQGYAIPALNFENMEMAQAIIEAANELRSPVILQTTPSTAKYIGLEVASGIIQGLACKYDIPVVLHLDHGDSIELVEKAIKAGYSSVMIDGSKLSFDKNVEITKRARELTSTVQLEAEIGKVGGKEDDMESDGPSYTSFEEASEFARQTKVDSLAIGVGTAHGLYKGTPVIRTDLIKEIAANIKTPLVLHGASGLSDDVIKECVESGICKINFATELRIAFTKSIIEFLDTNRDIIDPKKYLLNAKNNVKMLVCEKIRLCKSNNRV